MLTAGVRVSFFLFSILLPLPFPSLHSSYFPALFLVAAPRQCRLRRSSPKRRESPFSLSPPFSPFTRRRWFPHLSGFLLSRVYSRRIGIGRSLRARSLVTTCPARRFAGRFRLCISRDIISMRFATRLWRFHLFSGVLFVLFALSRHFSRDIAIERRLITLSAIILRDNCGAINFSRHEEARDYKSIRCSIRGEGKISFPHDLARAHLS